MNSQQILGILVIIVFCFDYYVSSCAQADVCRSPGTTRLLTDVHESFKRLEWKTEARLND